MSEPTRDTPTVDGSKIDDIRHNLAIAENAIEGIPYLPPEAVLPWVKPLAAMARALLDELDRTAAAPPTAPVQSPPLVGPVEGVGEDRTTDSAEERLRELCKSATPGPWLRVFSDAQKADHVRSATREWVAQFAASEADAEFIAAAREAVPSLLARLAAVEREAAELRTENERLRTESAARATFINGAAAAQVRIAAEHDEARSQLADTRTQLAVASEGYLIARANERALADRLIVANARANGEAARADAAEARLEAVNDEATYDDVYTELSLALGTDDSADEDVDFKRDLTDRIMRHFRAALSVAPQPEPDGVGRLHSCAIQGCSWAEAPQPQPREATCPACGQAPDGCPGVHAVAGNPESVTYAGLIAHHPTNSLGAGGEASSKSSPGRDEPSGPGVEGRTTEPQPEPDESSFCPRDHGCSLPAGHEGDCELTAALCFCPTCEAKAEAASLPVEPAKCEHGEAPDLMSALRASVEDANKRRLAPGPVSSDTTKATP